MKIRYLIIVCVSLLASCRSEPLTRSFTVDQGEVARPTVAVSPLDGSAYWSWIRKDDDGWNVYVSALGSGADVPDAPVRVNHIPGNASPHDEAPAQVAAAPNGDIYVAWTNRIDIAGRRFPASNLLFSVSKDGGKSFSKERAINSDSEEYPSGHTFHNILVLDDGTIVASWIDSRERDRVLRVTSSKPNADVDDHKAMHGVGMRAGSEKIRGSQIRIARSIDGGETFLETTVVDDNSCPCCRTVLASGSDGVVYVAWRHVFDNGDRDIVIARSDDSGLTFTEPVSVSRDGWNIDACPHAGPALTVDDADRVHVAWFTGAEDGPGLYRALSTDRAASFGSRIPVARSIPMAYAAFTREAEGRVALSYSVPSENSLVTVSIDGTRPIDTSAETGGRPSLASARGVVARAIAEHDAVRGDVVRF